jgi:hypothetical protein
VTSDGGLLFRYYCLRLSLALFGVLMVSSGLLFLAIPDLAHSDGPPDAPPDPWGVAEMGFLLYGVLLLVPFRVLKQPPLFPLAMFVFTLSAVWTAYRTFLALIEFVRWQEALAHWLLLPFLIIPLLLTLAAPRALILLRRLDADAK